ncbi:hypothetical protein M378DRAFT_803679 [Amanita muscaria Koide BX008]|uniref:Uncharacterized protein n=1 Tax=Amanita muscaria (strain Koide BX008) TaxID=946122 RepID=A0A0C2SGF6_AMAMK|nr:hypothetical protein M378DRAFT_803679 [Amanita muscaria Koide BX008]
MTIRTSSLRYKRSNALQYNLLRHPHARSLLDEMAGETHFRRYLPEPLVKAELVAPEEVKRHIVLWTTVLHVIGGERHMESRMWRSVGWSRSRRSLMISVIIGYTSLRQVRLALGPGVYKAQMCKKSKIHCRFTVDRC